MYHAHTQSRQAHHVTDSGVAQAVQQACVLGTAHIFDYALVSGRWHRGSKPSDTLTVKPGLTALGRPEPRSETKIARPRKKEDHH